MISPIYFGVIILPAASRLARSLLMSNEAILTGIQLHGYKQF
jgi:hypothetical protein